MDAHVRLGVFVFGRLDKGVVFFCDVSVCNGDDANRTNGGMLVCCRLEVDGNEVMGGIVALGCNCFEGFLVCCQEGGKAS